MIFAAVLEPHDLHNSIMRISVSIGILITGLIISCLPGYRYNTGTFPENPVNMGAINSEYDDYNSDSPVIGGSSPLCFSSNRNTRGKDFDIIYLLLDVYMSKRTGVISVDENTGINLDVYAANENLLNATSVIKTGYDELGPYLIPQGGRSRGVGSGYESFQKYIFLYASDDKGHLEIKLTHNLTSDVYSVPEDLDFLNSDSDDAYPTFDRDTSHIFFCSDREGNFDIYSVPITKNGTLLATLTGQEPVTVIKEAALSCGSNDKCPYIQGNRMVFTSDRPGGFGGFDLYYSVFTDGNWSEPVNFGDKINTPYDEYRPIVKTFDFEFTNDMMIFSSDRPGGLGGFDLYYVGIKRMP